MKRILIALSIQLYSVIAFGQNTILWSQDRKLTWEDFRGTPHDSSFAAATYCGISYNICKKDIWTGKVLLKVDCTFDKDTSWVLSNRIHALTLRHEQLHFDIAELYARKLRQEFEKEKFNTINVSKKANEVYQKIYNEYFEFQTLYEQETEFGTQENEQKEWEVKIKLALEALDKYKNNSC